MSNKMYQVSSLQALALGYSRAVVEVGEGVGVPFAAVAPLRGERRFRLPETPSIQALRAELTLRIEEDYGLNSMHVVRIDGLFGRVDARSEAPYRSHHVTLKKILASNQTSLLFEDIRGTLVGVGAGDQRGREGLSGQQHRTRATTSPPAPAMMMPRIDR